MGGKMLNLEYEGGRKANLEYGSGNKNGSRV